MAVSAAISTVVLHGKSDIVWQHVDGWVSLWLMNGFTMTSGASVLGPGTGWSVTHCADLNGDGKADLLWKHTDGSAQAWLMDGVTATSSATLTGPGTFLLVPAAP